MSDTEPQPDIEWRETGTEGVHDLYVDGRLVEYDVPVDYRQDALYRARVPGQVQDG